MSVKLVIAGSRGLDPTIEEIDSALAECEVAPSDVASVLCGMAAGVDLAGKAWADHHGIKVDEYPADWKKFGKAGGLFRNYDMAQQADCGLLFWDGTSPGTANMIANLALLRKPMWVVDMKRAKKEPSLIVNSDGRKMPGGLL